MLHCSAAALAPKTLGLSLLHPASCSRCFFFWLVNRSIVTHGIPHISYFFQSRISEKTLIEAPKDRKTLCFHLHYYVFMKYTLYRISYRRITITNPHTGNRAPPLTPAPPTPNKTRPDLPKRFWHLKFPRKWSFLRNFIWEMQICPDLFEVSGSIWS